MTIAKNYQAYRHIFNPIVNGLEDARKKGEIVVERSIVLPIQKAITMRGRFYTWRKALGLAIRTADPFLTEEDVTCHHHALRITLKSEDVEVKKTIKLTFVYDIGEAFVRELGLTFTKPATPPPASMAMALAATLPESAAEGMSEEEARALLMRVTGGKST